MRKLLQTAETFDENINRFTTIIYEENGNLYHQIHPGKHFELSNLKGILVSKDEIWPSWDESFTCVDYSSLCLNRLFIKNPNILGYVSGKDFIKKSFLNEIENYEVLKKNPHPNICKYHGCIRKGEHVSGICLRKYEYTLRYALKNKIPFDKEKCIREILEGINYLHSLNF